jgi:hypothetical protein
MENKKIVISHLKSKSINKSLTLNDIISNNKIINDYIPESNNFLTDSNNLKSSIKNNYNNKEGNKNRNGETNIPLDFRNTFEDINQNVLDIYYDKSSDFKNKIDGLNLQFYLETEKYLNCNNKNDLIRSQKLQANLFIILFKQINIFIEEIERLNKLILENKFKKETILKRTNELNEKKKNIIIKDTYVQSLKQTKTNTEKKLLESLLHEDKLMKDNERLRKENETYKTLTIMFQNEINNNKRKNGSFSPFHKKNISHIKTNSDYGIPSISTIGDIYRTNTGRCVNIYNDNILTLSNEKVINTNYNRDNLEDLDNNKNNSKSNNIYDKNRMKNKVKKIKKNIKNNNIKINKCNQLLRNNTLKENIKIKLKPTFIPRKNNKISHDIRNEKKNKTKNDFPSLNKFVKSKSKNIQIKIYEVGYNLKINNSCKNKKPINSEKITKRKNIATSLNNNLNFNISNTNSYNNTIMIETNNNSSLEKITARNGGKLNIRNGQKKRNTSEKSFTGTVRVEALNEELNNLLSNQINHLYTQTINRPKGTNYKIKKSFSHKFDLKKNNKIEKIISIQD